MTSPCPTCGETKTDPVWHRAMYKLVWAFGYRLHRCSRCRALRFIPRDRGKCPDSSQLGNEPADAPGFAEERGALRTAEARPELKKDQVTAADSSHRDLRRCPVCGSTKYHRTKRTTMERMLHRPSMASCESCGMRFPYPGPREEYPGALKLGGMAATLHRPAEERETPGMGEESSGPKVTQEVTVVDYPNHGLRCCPACGSTKYRRSKRTTLERMLRRPSMARCESCEMRFPYPRHHDESPDSAKSVEAAASVNHVGEEGRASRTTEESSQLNVDQQGTAADSSNGGLICCPVCGSTAHRRSRRTTLERLLLRPPMARCRNCWKRFPYPKR
jgi:hypothetical protein